MNKKIFAFVVFAMFATTAFSAATIITAAVIGGALYAGASLAVAVAIGLVASAVISKAFKIPTGYEGSGSSPDLGNRQQVPPATDNKLPVVYGQAYVGGIITDLTITTDNQTLYYVLSLCEVTNTNSGQNPDVISFGNIYWGGKLCTFDTSDLTKVVSLTDESTGEVDTSVSGKMYIYLYNNGSYSPTNSSEDAITVLSASNLEYKWDSTKLMTNCAFAILKLNYNQDAGITGIQQTKFQVTNSRNSAGDCIYDYLINTRYGAAINATQINTTSLTALNAYANANFTYTDYDGVTTTQPRFKFNGIIDTTRPIMPNLQDMTSCCDCLLKYNEITAQWGVIVQSSTYTVAMALDDSNIVSAITITPIDLTGTYNIVEVKYPNQSAQDSFDSVTYDLNQIDPSLLFPNEPVNKQSLSLPLVNNNVQAQLLANRFLKSAREDLQIQLSINFVGIQLDAGDIVTITNVNYGWVAKEFRVLKVIEEFADDGAVLAKLTLSEFNASVYDDVSITEFNPAPNTGLPDPTVFGVIPAPVVTAQYPNNTNPLFLVSVTTSSAGIIQYAEVWYSAFSNPTSSQLLFAGTTEIQSNGNPYAPNTIMPTVSLVNIPSGNWYFFSRMVNSLASSSYSPASSVLLWRPSTFQFTERYLAVAYADDITGTGFSLSPTNKEFYGLINQSGTGVSSTASDYTWYPADPDFGTTFYLAYANRTNRKFSFGSGTAVVAGGNGAFVPSNALLFDPSVWSALPLGTNIIDLDKRTGQLTETGTTSVGEASGELAITNNPDGKIVAQLKPFLNFGGSPTFTGAVSNLTVDIYGRVVGFEPPDAFYFTKQSFTATSGQTAFSVTRASGYITDQCWVFQNGCLLDESEYTDSLTTVTLGTGAVVGDIITVISFKSENATSGVYASFTRNTVDLTNATSYTASGFTLTSGYEFIFINGTVLNELDYNITDQTISDFPSNITGKMTIIQWSPDNLGQPNGFPNNIVAFTVVGQTVYTYSYDVNAFNLYSNGVILLQGTDYTTATGTYQLAETPTTTSTVMVQQTFARTGAV